MTARQIGLALGPLVFAVTLLTAPPAGMDGAAWLVAGLVVWMAAWWMTEAVPLTATASGQHVLTATSYSKSVLRASAGLVAEELDHVDYFPSFEIITHPVFGGRFFASNARSVKPEGVETVMGHFFADQARCFGLQAEEDQKAAEPGYSETDIQCEEALLDAFAS